MSLHPKELLQIYIILCPFASRRNETGEIPAVLQDSLSGEVVPNELLYLAQDFACRLGVSGEIVRFWGFQLPDRRVQMKCHKIPWTFSTA